MSAAVQYELTDDINCIDCGYNLRGLDQAGRCPECNAEISRSLHGDLLRFANPRWLARAIQGVLLFFWSFVLGMVASGVVPLAYISNWSRDFAAIVSGLLGIVGVLLSVVSAFYITAREPRATPASGLGVWRHAVRTAAVVRLVLLAMSMVVRLTDPVLSSLAALLRNVAAIVFLFGVFTAVETFLSRIPDVKLARKASIAKWGLCGLTFAAPVLGYLVLRLAPGTDAGGQPLIDESMNRMLRTGSCTIGLAYLALSILACWVLWQGRIELRATLAQAKVWAGRESARQE